MRGPGVALLLAGLVAVSGCTSGPTDPRSPDVSGARERAMVTGADRLQVLTRGARVIAGPVVRDLCVRPESTTFGRPADHALECQLTQASAVALPDARAAGELHETALAAGCSPQGAEDLRAWGAAYPPDALPELRYACGSTTIVYAPSRTAELPAWPPTVGRTGETLVSERGVDPQRLAEARRAPQPLAVWVGVLDDYWRK